MKDKLPICVRFIFLGLQVKYSTASKNDRGLQVGKTLDSKCSKWDESEVLERGLKVTQLKARS